MSDYPEGLLEFETRYGETFTTNILEIICGLGSADVGKWTDGVYLWDYETLDREGGNVLYRGEVKVGPRVWEFEIQSGNWNGTDIRSWERARILSPLPINTIWIYVPVNAIVVSYQVSRQAQDLRNMFAKFMQKRRAADG